jgi:hypothetical protein
MKKKWLNTPNPWLKTENFDGYVKVYYDNLLRHFTRFRNNLFVETGTHLGNGLRTALDAGHVKCYTIEIHQHLHQDACQRFATEIADGRVECHHGDSAVLLPQIIARLDQQATFWLDAHISSNYGDKLAKNCPIFEELDAIDQSAIKTHTIVIDDVACFDNKAHDNIPLAKVKERISQINPQYKFEFLDAHLPGNILVAYV